MKKLIILITLLILFAFSKSVFAETSLNVLRVGSTSASREGIKTSVEANLTENLRERAKTEITRRLNFLNELLIKLKDIKKISDTDKASLQSQIQAQVDGLTMLQAKIDADTDITTLRTDVKSIINGYYIFAFFRVKVSLLFAVDRSLTVSDSLTMISTKLKARIDSLPSGSNVSSLNALLTDMNTKISDAKLQLQAVQTELNGLSATGFPGNKSTLLDARKKIKTAALDLKTAYQDAKRIRQGLGDLGEKTSLKLGTDSATENTKNIEPTE